MGIHIHNLRTSTFDRSNPTHARIDRGTPLGNPFHITAANSRAEIIAQYRVYLYALLRRPEGEPQRNEIRRLLNILDQHNELHLFCWCAPLPCHGNIISELLNRYLSVRRLPL